MNELEKMIKGKLYDCNDQELIEARKKAHKLCYEYNNTLEDLETKRREIIKELSPNSSDNCFLQGPIYFDYGFNIKIGEWSYANFNLTILDTCKVTIGDNVMIGPNVSIYTALHAFDKEERRIFFDREKGYYTDREYGKEVVIDSDTWICGNVVICPGVHIGSGCVIGAGSVVTRNIPAGSLAFGNPCKIIRKINESDKLIYRKDLF